MVLRLLSF